MLDGLPFWIGVRYSAALTYVAAADTVEIPGIPSWAGDIVKAMPFAALALGYAYLERKERLAREAYWTARYDVLVKELKDVTSTSLVANQRLADMLGAAKRSR